MWVDMTPAFVSGRGVNRLFVSQARLVCSVNFVCLVGGFSQVQRFVWGLIPKRKKKKCTDAVGTFQNWMWCLLSRLGHIVLEAICKMYHSLCGNIFQKSYYQKHCIEQAFEKMIKLIHDVISYYQDINQDWEEGVWCFLGLWNANTLIVGRSTSVQTNFSHSDNIGHMSRNFWQLFGAGIM